MSNITLKDIRNSNRVKAYIQQADDHLGNLGYTEHGFRHASLVAEVAGRILAELDYAPRQVELARIAGYLHDIGNLVNRADHAHSSAVLAEKILTEFDVSYQEIGVIIGAIGRHDHRDGAAVNAVTAALIIADKSDVHYSRVRNREVATFDIHDRVNYAAKGSDIEINQQEKTITLDVEIDTEVSLVMEYFEIFLDRMVMSRKAAEVLNCHFHLLINGAQIM